MTIECYCKECAIHPGDQPFCHANECLNKVIVERPIVIVDLDNCISADAWRVGMIDHTKDDPYEAYHWHLHLDKAHNLDIFERHAGCAFAIFTARPEKYRGATIAWLAQNGIPFHWLFMRGDCDHRGSVALKLDMLSMLLTKHPNPKIHKIYDDRADVLAAFERVGIATEQRKIADVCYHAPCEAPPQKRTAADILFEMAETYRERNRVYGDNFRMVAKLVAVLFPNGVPPELVVTDQWHLFELKLVKLSRFAISNLTHIDSIHDDAVYAAMIESIIREGDQPK